jgi:mannobiose 2-epimerase
MQEGYFEAFTRNWQPIDDMRLSSRDANEKKTTNTHLHVLEAYSNLYRVWKDYRLGDALRQLIDIFRLHIVDSLTGHQKLFFDTDWTAKGDLVSYGHDIEAAWLLLDAAETLGDASLVELTKKSALQLAEAATSGLQPDGSMIYEKDGNHTDADRHWWVQAEAVTGYMHAYRISGDSRYLQYSRAAWEYIQHNLIDREKGEWYWSRRSDGSINRSDDKAGFWKCPYHNSRMCFEMMNSAE